MKKQFDYITKLDIKYDHLQVIDIPQVDLFDAQKKYKAIPIESFDLMGKAKTIHLNTIEFSDK